MNQESETEGHGYLRQLLAERNQSPDRVAEIDSLIRQKFERRVAIFVLDMSGFSRLTIEFGIIHYLAMIEQMDNVARPAIEKNGGTTIKQEADNIFAIFETPVQAVDAARDILLAFGAVNTVVPDPRDLYGSVGIGYGESLVVAGKDMFGSEVNLACKLGEDLAERSEILLTSAAYAEIPKDRYVFEPRSYSISGIELPAWKLLDVVEADVILTE